MNAHAKYSPSSAHRWMRCAGSMVLEQEFPNESTDFADEGTAAHTLGSDCLTSGADAAEHLGRVIQVDQEDDDGNITSSRSYTVDESMAMHVQVYIDLVRSYVAQGYTLLVEQRVEFTRSIGGPAEGRQFGTADAILVSADGTHLIVIDLKYGAGVSVYAKESEQMLSYAVGVLETFGFVYEDVRTLELIICQPRKDNIDVWPGPDDPPLTVEYVQAFAKNMATARLRCALAGESRKETIPDYLVPGPKQCQWCRAKSICPALTQMVANEVLADFEALDTEEGIAEVAASGELPRPAPQLLGAKYGILGLIEAWTKAVRAECERQVFAGMTVIGPDGEPMKLVEGKKGDREWIDKEKAKGVLAGHLTPDKLFKPQEIISPAQAGKILDKKKTKATWNQIKPLYRQSPGQAKVVLGSDPRPAYKAQAEATEFEDLTAEDDISA